MPSSEYYRRQAGTLLALALSTKEPPLAALCRHLAIEYTLLAEQAAAERLPAPRHAVPDLRLTEASLSECERCQGLRAQFR